MNRELRVEARGVGVIIAVLVVQVEQVTEIVTGILEALQSLPPTRGGGGRHLVGMLAVVAFVGPAGQADVQAIEPSVFELAQVGSAFVERREMIILLRLAR